MDFATLSPLRKAHPAWRLLVADHAPLIATFLHRGKHDLAEVVVYLSRAADDDIPELHDRLIAATAKYIDLPLITNDPEIVRALNGSSGRGPPAFH